MDFMKPQKLQYVWCIDCQEEVVLDLNLLDGMPIHTICIDPGNGWDVPPDYEPCSGPFTSCPPPDNFSDDWDLNIVEPSAEELAEMNLRAEILLQELEG